MHTTTKKGRYAAGGQSLPLRTGPPARSFRLFWFFETLNQGTLFKQFLQKFRENNFLKPCFLSPGGSENFSQT